jgi:uncharacterized membrane protein YfcA
VWLLLAICTFVVAIIASMLGQGGGVVYTPLQVWLGIRFHVAATTSLFLIMVTSVSASMVFHKANRIDWPLAIALESVTAVGAFSGGLASGWLSESTLAHIFAGVVGVAAIFMILPLRQREPYTDGRGGLLAWRRIQGDHPYYVNMALALPAAFLAGVFSGMLGVGGGIMKVPLLVLLLRVPMDIAVGSSALMVGVTALGGFAGHLPHGHWNWKLSLILAAAVFIGGQIGSRVTVRLDKEKLRAGFGWFLLLVATTMVIKGLQ